MSYDIEHIDNDLDATEYLSTMLIDRSTGGCPEDSDYIKIRRPLVNNPIYKDLIPRWLKTNRSLDQFWQFIKNKFPSYAERREFIRDELAPLLDFIESKETSPATKNIDEILSAFDDGAIYKTWQIALERKSKDPEGAITISRTLLEKTCKHILHALQEDFNEKNIDLSELYKLTAKKLNLSVDQHSEPVFKQILGGCSGIINGLGTLRNKHGDAHAASRNSIKPQPRHAELAVNLAGTMATFLISTYKKKHTQDS